MNVYHFLLFPLISKSILGSRTEDLWFQLPEPNLRTVNIFPVFPIPYIFTDKKKKKICVITTRLLRVNLRLISCSDGDCEAQKNEMTCLKSQSYKWQKWKKDLDLWLSLHCTHTASLHPLYVLKIIKFLPELGFIQCSSW